MSVPEPTIQVQKTYQVCLVVKDIQKAMENFWDILGIGPWNVYTYEPPELTDTTLRGKPQDYSMKLALAFVGDVCWELVEPLEGPSIYKEFLEEKGEGLHHIQFQVDDYDKAMAAFEKKGIDFLMGGTYKGGTYAYMDTEEPLKMIAEFATRRPGGIRPPPERVWPPQD
ncbi:MAG: VOC family protein [SAR202 cluster bacterium]|nr:VOC family protein [SAR202 cluster bacterium]